MVFAAPVIRSGLAWDPGLVIVAVITAIVAVPRITVRARIAMRTTVHVREVSLYG